MSMTHDEMIAVIQHHKNGGKVEFLSMSGGWILVADNKPNWNFATTNYRPKPEPMVLWIEVTGAGYARATYKNKPESKAYAYTTLKKFQEVTE
jgi:hypothetical protein